MGSKHILELKPSSLNYSNKERKAMRTKKKTVITNLSFNLLFTKQKQIIFS